MNIVILNQPLNNRGDESAHKALVRTLNKSFPNANFEILFVGAKNDTIEQFSVKGSKNQYINYLFVRAYRFVTEKSLRYNLLLLWYFHPTLRKIINRIKKADYVICAPGGICMGGFQNWEHICLLYIAKKLHKRIAYYGRSFGPFPIETKANQKFKAISSQLLHSFDFLSIRDVQTQCLANEMGLSYIPTVDTAFLETIKCPISDAITDKIGECYMVFIPNLLIWHYAYRDVPREKIEYLYLQMINLILAMFPNMNIVMLPQTFNFGTESGDDIIFFHALSSKILSDRVVVLSDTYSSDIQQTIFSKAKFVVGARYHSIVFSINNNVPFVALSYEHKMFGLLQSLAIQDRVVDLTYTFQSSDGMKQTFEEFESLIRKMTLDPSAKQKAKMMAINCYRKLEMRLKEIECYG